MGKVVHITDSNFTAEVTNSSTPVLVDFWASWCQPCLQIAPMVEALAEEYQGKIKVGKVNVDEEPHTASQFGIRSIPTLIVFQNGKAVDQHVGSAPKEKIDALIKKHVA